MPLKIGAARVITTEPLVQPLSAELDQLSAVVAICVIGLCVSLMALAPIAGEWLVAIQYGL